MDKNVDDILSKSQYGQIRRLISLVNLSMDKNVDDILSKSQYGQKRRYPQKIIVWTKRRGHPQ